MRKWLPAIVLLCAAAIGVYFFANPQRTPPGKQDSTQRPATDFTNSPSPPIIQTAAVSSAASTPALVTDTITTYAPSTAPANEPMLPPVVLPEPASPDQEIPNLPQSTVLENVRATFRQYQSKFGGNPVGTNLEITRALNGENLRQIRFLRSEDGMKVNAKGELIDTWGTPYFFHQLSGTEMEIHSAGPDKKMWTSDDLVTK